MAALPRPLHPQRASACWQRPAPGCAGHDQYHLRTGDAGGGQWPVASSQWRTVADWLRAKFPKLASKMDDAEHEVLAFMGFPKAHRTQIHSTNPLERINAEVKRRTNVIGIFPNDQAIIRLVGAMMLEQNDEWSLKPR